MRHFKIFLVAFAIITSTNIHANTNPKFADGIAVSQAIQKLVRESRMTCEEGFTVTVFFSISEDNKIQNVSVASSNVKISEYLQRKLESQALSGEYWRHGKIYELSVVNNRMS